VAPLRSPIAGIEAITAALAVGAPIRVLLVERDDASPSTQGLLDLARARGVAIWRGSAGDLRRMSRGVVSERAIAMAGPEPTGDMTNLLQRGGAVWLLQRAAYPSNVGFAIRTAEVSGADGVVVDATFTHDERARISHVSMGADRLLPVLWESADRTVELARHHGHRIIAIEDAGDSAPWDLDLKGAVLLVVGNERHGIEPELLARCDAVARVPMAGFVPSYNLQAAISAVAIERLRQLAARP
jgi:23S rRNA (guanosine2251-2'-O)-methyltransferase